MQTNILESEVTDLFKIYDPLNDKEPMIARKVYFSTQDTDYHGFAFMGVSGGNQFMIVKFNHDKQRWETTDRWQTSYHHHMMSLLDAMNRYLNWI